MPSPPLPESLEPYWTRSGPIPVRPGLGTDLAADVVVIGAGIAGLSTAWELSRAGRHVAVLEADRIACGVTGHTTAKISSLHMLHYSRLRRTRGAEEARLYARSQQEAVERVVELSEELRIECDLERTPAFTYTTDPAGVPALRAEAEAAREAGLPATFTRSTGLPFEVAGSVRVEDQAQFHPRKYLAALAADLEARGSVIHERTRVTGLESGEPCKVTTENGAVVMARDIVIATHYPVFDQAMLFARLAPRRELVVAGPVAADLDPGGMYITEEQNRRSVRTAPYTGGRRLLIVTGESHRPGTGDSVARFHVLADWTRQRFPGTEITYRWAAQDNDSTDTVPLIGPFTSGAGHVYVATGFGGWGMTGGVLAGGLLATAIIGQEAPWAALYAPRRMWSTLREAPDFVKHQAVVAKHFLGDLIRTAYADSPADVPPGGGAVVRIGGHACAVHRDDDGALHAVSARCTHLGCLVAFNAAERTWECPCHGSRYGTDGTVLEGPANRPLESRDAEVRAAQRREQQEPPASG